MKLEILLALVAAAVLKAGVALETTGPTNTFFRTFECVNGHYCQRTSTPVVRIDPKDLKSKNEHTTIESCRLVCGRTAGLWPVPTGASNYSKNYIDLDPNYVRYEGTNVAKSLRLFISEIWSQFTAQILLTCGPIWSKCRRRNTTMSVAISVKSGDEELDWNTDESYRLRIVTKGNEINATIKAATIYGARHALETLSQLIVRVVTEDGTAGLAILDYASISDAPVFPHRGLLIDTARNFLPVSDITRTIDALAASKMNVLHWHATDSQSFPLRIKRRPFMSLYGAYSTEMTYSPEDLGHVVRYAKYRGVRVILELDSPSHVGAGWEWGPAEGLGNIAVCVNQQPWRDYCIQPPCGQINPVNPNAYEVLRDIYRDVLEVIGTRSTLHLGGDEVFINCWNSTPEIASAMESSGMGRSMDDFLQLWANFHTKQRKILDEIKGGANDSTILWSSALTSPEIISRHLDKNRFVVQTWLESSSPVPYELLKLGYRLIMSTKNAWYLDHGFWGRTQFHTWRDAYNNRIPRHKGVLGGEACMWGEYVNGGGLDSRVWPRAAAVAERLWSDPTNITTRDAEPRLQSHKTRLETRFVYGDALTPEWCNQHERMCL